MCTSSLAADAGSTQQADSLWTLNIDRPGSYDLEFSKRAIFQYQGLTDHQTPALVTFDIEKRP